MPDDNNRVWAARTLASQAARQGRWTDLPQWVDALSGAEDRARACLSIAESCFALPSDVTSVADAAQGEPGKVFKAIDQTQPGFYGDGKWSYIHDVPNSGARQGILKYDGRDLPAAQPGDYIWTPWGWMQWQHGTWLPVAEKPTTGKQLPTPAR
jgi:hypothetical protein